MILFFVLAVGVLLFGCRFRSCGALCDALGREQTAALNGFFVLLVFLSHAFGYLSPAGPLDAAYAFAKTQLGQLIVAPFLFFSGYGILLSISQKGKAYLRAFPLRRFGRVLFHAELAVLLFWICNFFLRAHYGAKRTLLAFTFWEGIGNSNWYLFVVLALYVLVFVSFWFLWNRPIPAAAILTGLTVGLGCLLFYAGKEDYWYNTLAAFPLGMWFALGKDRLLSFLQKSPLRRWLFTAAAILVFGAGILLRGRGLVFYTICEAGFLLCVVAALLILRFDNPLLRFFGRHVFSIFILQRIPMRVLAHLGLATNRWLFVSLSCALTLLLAVGFDCLTQKLDQVLLKG